MPNSRVSAAAMNELVDATIDRYLNWREESADVDLAYRRWVNGAHADRGLHYAAYVEALDREEHAAREYRAFVEQISTSV